MGYQLIPTAETTEVADAEPPSLGADLRRYASLQCS